MLKDVSVNEITRVISLATAPAFLLGAVAALLSLLVARLTRIGDLVRALVTDRERSDEPWKEVALREGLRRIWYIRWAITLCAHSGIVTGWMVVLVFVDALFDFQNSQAIALAFIAAMVLFTTALLFLLLEIRLSIADLTRIQHGHERSKTPAYVGPP
ncbi:DUF2721 domain-containing protein [Methylobacterium sp. J-070]|uniref:DUF2721 domain-containing protein n=1 Tax=Methylobacterium sp. J-070 TaxID=2836650 RepID=UPI001FBAF93F|nr:DUF2721 domain-containing protein [Methylobacterium sp. J-070]MCJ2051809.1 DUF2721 domain-containing protein [Methylobacterium sp. J-070]